MIDCADWLSDRSIRQVIVFPLDIFQSIILFCFWIKVALHVNALGSLIRVRLDIGHDQFS